MEETTLIEINNTVLVWARESLAINRNQVSERTSISAKRLIQLEDGEKLPTLHELKELSKLYKRTIATLLLSKPPKEKPLPSDRRTIDSKELGNFHEKTIMAVRKARALAQSFVELKKELNEDIPSLNFIASIEESAQSVAVKVRNSLKLEYIREITNTNQALEIYIQRVESLGIGVYQLMLPQDEIRGFTILDESIPIIGIKRNDSPSAKTFTLFHELAHVLLNKDGLCDLSQKTNIEIEKWCNAFSAEILIPVAELLEMESVVEYKRQGNKIWLKKDLIALAGYFHVGPLAILRSLLENQLTTYAYYNERHQEWNNKPQFGRSKNPEGRNIPKEAIREKGRNYISLAFTAFDQNRIDLKDLSDFLGIKLNYITKTRQLLNS